MLIFVAALLPRVTNLDVFLAHDETLFWDWSHQFFFSLLAGNLAGTIVGPGNPNIMPMWAQVVEMSLEYGWAWLNGVQATALRDWPAFQSHLVFSELAVRRLPVVLINTLSMTGIWWLCHRLFGRRLALIAAVLLILDPFYLADSRTGRGEGMLSGFITIALLAFIFFWRSGRQRYLIVSGFVTGLALLTKMSAVSLGLLGGLMTIVYVWPTVDLSTRDKLRQIFLVLTIWGGVALITFWALWPAMWVAPIEALNFLWGFARNVGLEGRTNYYFGQLYQSEFLPLYYPIVFILRVTPVALAGLIAFVVLLVLVGAAKVRAGLTWDEVWRNVTRNLITRPILWVALFPLIFGLFMTVGILKRDWYLMPAFPSLDIVAAAGLLWVTVMLNRHFWPQVSLERVWGVGLGLILLLQAGFSLPSHPLYYTYWNPLVLGGQWAARAIMVGWDLDLGLGAHYLNDKTNPDHLKVATRTTRGFQEIFKGTTLPLAVDSSWIQADYLLVRQTHLQLGKHDPWELAYLAHLKLDHLVNVGGVDYLWIYQGPQAQYFAGSKLDGLGLLFGYNLDRKPTPAGSTVPLKLFWQNDGRGPDDVLWVRLVGADGYVWAENLAQPLPDFADAALTDKAVVESQVNLTIPVGTPPGVYFLKMGFQAAGTSEDLGAFALPGDGDKLVVTRPAGPVSPAGLPIDHSLDQVVTSNITLLGYSLPDDLLTQSDANRLTLFWQAQTTVEQDYVLALQLLDRQGQEAAYWLGRPVMSGYPTNEWMAGEIVHDPWQLKLPANVSPGDYTLHLTLFDAATEAEVNRVTLGEVSVVDRRHQFDLPPMQQTVNAGLDNRVTLLGYDFLSKPITGGGRLRVTLYWQARQTLPHNYTVFVQLLGPDGTVVGQHDGIPDEGRLPTTTWQAGEIISDRHQIDYPTVQKGEYRLIIGMYDPQTGTRLPVVASSGAQAGDFLFLQSFEIR